MRLLDRQDSSRVGEEGSFCYFVPVGAGTKGPAWALFCPEAGTGDGRL